MASNPTPTGTGTTPDATPFVGRQREVATLSAGLDATLAQHTRLFLVAGEPGIGKTRLAAEVGREAATRGALVCWGRCCEDAGAPPFWPWTQVLRTLIEANASAATLVDVRNPLVAHMLSDSGGRLSGNEPPPPRERRFELFDAVLEMLRRAAAVRPLILLIDDLHAADVDSLLLLHFLARHLDRAAVLVIGTYRPADLERSPERAEAVAAIARIATGLPLTALSEADVTRLVATAVGLEVSPDLAASVFRTTEGHPFFVAELVQLLLAGRDSGAGLPHDITGIRLPHGIRALIGDRLRPLTPASRSVLEAAAILGREFHAAVVQHAVGATAAGTREALLEAENAGLIARSHGDLGDGDVFAFTHGLIRETLLAPLDAENLARLHRRAAEALERRVASRTNDLARIAYHYTRAAPFGDWQQAVDYADRAAQQAMRQWAYDEASRLYDQALEALDLAESPMVDRRLELLCAKARAEHAAGTSGARATWTQAADLARAHDRAEPLAEAALGIADLGLGILGLQPDRSAVELLEEAERRLCDDASPLSVRIRAHLAAHLSFPEMRPRSLALIASAARAARELGDDATLAAVLSQQHLVLWRFNEIDGRLAIADELIELAERLGESDLAWLGHAWRVVDCMTLGDINGVDIGLKVLLARAEASRQPRFLWMANNFRAARALWRGEWQEAETFALTCLQASRELADPIALLSAPIQLFLAWRECGREIDESELRKAVDRFPESAMVRSCLITVLLDRGLHNEARSELERVAADDFAGVRRERRLGVLAPLSDACWRLGETAHAPTLASLLEPFAAGNVMYAATACFGSAARYLGQLAALRCDWDAAFSYFAEAKQRNRAMGARALLAWTLFDEALAWRRRASSGEATADMTRRTALLLGEARELATFLSMQRLVAEIDRIASEAEAIPAMPTRLGVFRREGALWLVSTGATHFRVVDMKGMAYIAALLRTPGRPVAAIELDRSPGVPSTKGEPALDRPALDAYRRRLAEVRGELDAAEADNDLGRIGALQHEAGHIERELARAVGLHGRRRNLGSSTERARLNVTRAIRTAIRRIGEVDVASGRFLASTIRTGSVCLYVADANAPTAWSLEPDA